MQPVLKKSKLKTSKRDHVSPLLQCLHWLHIPARIDYKIATLAYHNFEDSLPPYLSSTLSIYHPSRSLRSSSEKLLKVPRKNLKSPLFQLSGSHCLELTSIWNQLVFSCWLQNKPQNPPLCEIVPLFPLTHPVDLFSVCVCVCVFLLLMFVQCLWFFVGFVFCWFCS